MMISSKTKTTCPWCGFKAELATRLAGGRFTPKNGDVNLCFKCCGFSVFSQMGNKFDLRRPTPQEDFEISHNQEMQQARRFLIERKRAAGK